MSTNLNDVEIIKANSHLLRGTLAQSLADDFTGALAPDDTQISKFHGFYQQDDRDQRLERQSRLLEPYYSFMLRARLPGGICTPEQWLVIDDIGRHLATPCLRLTTRQTFQFHGILKGDLKGVIQGINRALIDSIGGCGDVNRNVLCNPNPIHSVLHAEAYAWAKRISEHLLPRTRAYHELWLDGERVAATEESEPLYGETYLPRKFKTAVAVPPNNDVDVYANDLGFVAIAEEDRLLGFNVLAGGGMGVTHGDATTYPRLADELGFIELADTLAVADAVVTTQRDFGNRRDRRHARLKYTIAAMGLETFRSEVERRAGVSFAPARAVVFSDRGDRFGWVRGHERHWHLTLYIENGRIRDTAEASQMTGLREIARIHQGDFRLTPNQNLIIAKVPPSEKSNIESIARRHGLLAEERSRLRLQGLACVALPSCPQAMAEAERGFPELVQRLEALLDKHGLKELDLHLRMTGCPNGCARPYLAEIGLVGKGPGRYNLMLGGDRLGRRLNKLYRENLSVDQVLLTLDALLRRYTDERNTDEGFGDFVIRVGLVRAVIQGGRDFHE